MNSGRIKFVFLSLLALYMVSNMKIYFWRTVLVAALREIGLKPTTEDPNFWIREAMRPDEYKHYNFYLFMLMIL